MSVHQDDQAIDSDEIDRIAIAPNAPDQVPRLISEINTHGQTFMSGHSSVRAQLADAAESLLAALETPRETIHRQNFRNPTGWAAINIAIDLGIFRLLVETKRPMSTPNLASATGADPILLGRIMRHLGAIHAIVETKGGEYTTNGFSFTLAHRKYSDSILAAAGSMYPSINGIPEFLRQNDYRNPSDGRHCPLQMVYRTTDSLFEYLANNPVIGAQFNTLMGVYHQGRASWMDPGFYPVDQLMSPSPIGEHDVFLVDVGGGRGHDLSELRAKWPNLPGRLILQDQPAVLAEATNLHPSIEPVSHDFFTEQPIKGARAYFLHSILHDWPDKDCHQILEPLRAAMIPGVSRLLINDYVMPDQGAHWQATSQDINMMSILASLERTESQWRQLLTKAGFRVVNVWTVDRWSESLIECEVVASSASETVRDRF